MDNDPDKHFARIVPVVGAHLRERRVALVGLATGAQVVEYLAACGVRRWLWRDDDQPLISASTSAEYLRARLLAQHGAALGLDAQAVMRADWHAAVPQFAPDLVLGIGGAAELRRALAAARQTNAPALLVAPPDAMQRGAALCVFPGEYDAATMYDEGRTTNDKGINIRRWSFVLRQSHEKQSDAVRAGDSAPWDWQTAAPLCAGLARALLLRDTPCRRADLAALWGSGARRFTFGTHADPFDVQTHPLTPLTPLTRSPAHPLTFSQPRPPGAARC